MNPDSNRSVFPNYTTNSYNHHDIFLSHSGAQKGFAKDLYRVLTSHGFSTFFDITLHSLPPAEPFPKRIFDAASSCKLALVVLSHDYLSSKWPMHELCAFARATRSSVKIFPLFFHLLPKDLNDQNLERWRMQWSSFAESDPQRINVNEWEEAVALLRPRNGLVRDNMEEGELGFIERIVSSILVSSPSLAVTPRNRYDTSYVQGEARLRQIILDKFHEMESSCHHEQYVDRSNDGISCVLGIHGISGSGKSSMCRSLANYFFQLYSGRSLHVELPTNPTSSTLLYALKDFLSLITLHIGTEHVTHIDQLASVIKSHGRSSWNAMFLAVDNISEESITEVSRFLPDVIGLGSKVILIARTREALQPIMNILALQKYCTCDYLAMPSINEAEAMDILLQTTSGQGTGARAPGEAGALWRGEAQLDNYMVAQKQKVLQVVRMCGFGDSKDGPLMYLPVVMQRMGVALSIRQNNVYTWAHDQHMFWSSLNEPDVRSSRERVVTKLILNSFETILDEELQLLFMDVALFSKKFQDYLPWYQSCTSVLEKAYSTLAALHGKDEAEIKTMVGDLQRLCFIQRAIYDDGFVIHDLYREFANSFYESRFKHGAYGVHSCTGHKQVIYLDEKMVNQDKAGRPLRGMVLYLGSECEKLVLKNFPSLKALVVTHCVNLVTFRMEGLTSLATLDVIGFGRKLPIMKCSNVSLQNVRRLNLSCLAVYKKMNNTPEWRRIVFSRESTEASCCALGFNSEWIPAAWRPNQGPDMGIAMHMRCLRNLILRGTGIQKLEDMGSCWPHLQELHVHECLLTEFRLGALPALTTLVFKDCMDHYHHMTSYDYPMDVRTEKLDILQDQYRKELVETRRRLQLEQKGNVDTSILEGEGFLEGCPSLQKVRITSAFFRNAHLMKPSSKFLQVLELVCVCGGMLVVC